MTSNNNLDHVYRYSFTDTMSGIEHEAGSCVGPDKIHLFTHGEKYTPTQIKKLTKRNIMWKDVNNEQVDAPGELLFTRTEVK